MKKEELFRPKNGQLDPIDIHSIDPEHKIYELKHSHKNHKWIMTKNCIYHGVLILNAKCTDCNIETIYLNTYNTWLVRNGCYISTKC